MHKRSFSLKSIQEVSLEVKAKFLPKILEGSFRFLRKLDDFVIIESHIDPEKPRKWFTFPLLVSQ